MRSPRSALSLVAAMLLLAACGAPRAAVKIEPLAVRTPAAVDASPPAPVVRDSARRTASTSPSPTRPAVSEPSPNPVPPVSAYDVGAGSDDDPVLLAAIRETLGEDLDHYSVVVRRLSDGRGAAVNAERVHYAASLFKLALLYEAERQRSAGLLDFEDSLEIREEDIAEDLGTITSLGLGEDGTLPLREAVDAMVTRSDNTTAVALLRLLGPASVDSTLLRLGLRDTSLNTQALPTTAADMALLMEAIVRGDGVDLAWREDMLRLLLRQETRYGIPRLLPAGVRAGNKTGTWPGVTHDVAFVDAPGGLYVIAVLSDRGWVWDPIARVSRAVYDALR
jgi:beta-lactamase class A